MPAPRGLIQRVDQDLHRHARVLPRGERVLVACSGGADSVALLRVLHAVNQSGYWNWTLVVGHVDHATRRGSRGDAGFVKRLAKALGLGFAHKRLAWRRGEKRSEAALRERRYAALAALARQRRCGRVAVAHQAEDQAETVILRMLRGTGLRGLGAMAVVTRREGTIVVRPVLGVRREALRAYLAEVGQGFRTDPTNVSPAYLRNRVRAEVMPVLAGLRPGVVEALGRLAGQARDVERAMGAAARGVRRKAERGGARGGVTLERVVLRKVPRAVVARVLREALVGVGVGADALGGEALRTLVGAVRERTSGKRFGFAGAEVEVGREVVVVWGVGPRRRG